MEKTLDFHEAYVTCITCDLCYSSAVANDLPTYCQKLELSIDPRKVLDNMDRAVRCSAWFPRDIGRRQCGPNYDSEERHYEKDSLA
jgi:hypothetical protein